nr:MAG TPA: hypothetical protein [Bacteriophage sp.]
MNTTPTKAGTSDPQAQFILHQETKQRLTPRLMRGFLLGAATAP